MDTADLETDATSLMESTSYGNSLLVEEVGM